MAVSALDHLPREGHEGHGMKMRSLPLPVASAWVGVTFRYSRDRPLRAPEVLIYGRFLPDSSLSSDRQRLGWKRPVDVDEIL